MDMIFDKKPFGMKNLTEFLAGDAMSCIIKKDTLHSGIEQYDFMLVKVPVSKNLVAVYGKRIPHDLHSLDCLFIAKGPDIIGHVAKGIEVLLPASKCNPLWDLQETQRKSVLDAAVDIVAARYDTDSCNVHEGGIVDAAIDLFFDGIKPEMFHCERHLFDVCSADTRLAIYDAWPDAVKAAEIWLDDLTAKDGRTGYLKELKANVKVLKKSEAMAKEWDSAPNGAPYVMREIIYAIKGARSVTTVLDTQTGPIEVKLPTEVFRPRYTHKGMRCDISMYSIRPSLKARKTIENLLKSECVGDEEPKTSIDISRVRAIKHKDKTVYLRRDLRVEEGKGENDE